MSLSKRLLKRGLASIAGTVISILPLWTLADPEPDGGKASRTPGVGYEDLQASGWYNFYFEKGKSPFPTARARNEEASSSLTVHAAKVLSKESEAAVKITFPKTVEDHLAILAARARDQEASGAATTRGAAFREWEQSVAKWTTVFIDLRDVKRMTVIP